MSTLRRRIFGASSSDPSRALSPTEGEESRLVPVSKLHSLSRKSSTSKRRNGLIFGLGGLFGLVVAAFFAQQQEVVNLNGLLDLNLDSLLDVIPVGVLNEAKDITVRRHRQST